MGALADLPRLERASRRARARALLGSRWADRFGVTRRSLPWPARLLRLVRAGDWPAGRLAPAAGATCWGLAATEGLGVGLAVFLARSVLAKSVRVRSREVSARLPRLERASRRESTKSRLGLAIGRAGLRLADGDGTARLRLGVGTGALAAAATEADGLAAAAEVRVGRASSSERTRLLPEVNRLAAFLPPLVRALRRSRAASRLDVLAMSARRMDDQKLKGGGGRHGADTPPQAAKNQRPSKTTKQAPWHWVYAS